MSDLAARIAKLSPEKRALLAKRTEPGRDPSSSVTAREAIAIVGIGCRFPGASSPEALWQLLMDGVDAVTEIPSDRWDGAALYDPDLGAMGKSASRWGAFLRDVDRFDAEFFGIAPREAERMDPQQRLFLEAAWEALEDAAVPAESLAGASGGVFVGVHSTSADYYLRQSADLRDIDPYTGTGTAHSIVANRLSYVLDLRGPSLVVDTACSSSLVAVHLACQSLRAHECDIAIAGGVNLILSPEGTIACSKLQMMAADGRCKTFDARADGFVRGEGCGAVVLRRLSDALREANPIIALIRGTAINQDGATNGLTAPNGLSQQAVIRRALEDAGLDHGRVTYVETHGTGTALGDPIEVDALAEVLSQQAEQRSACYLGAIKTNFGHLEGAAGIAGLIKAALCLRHRSIPPNLHFKSLNPHLTLEGTRFVIPTRPQPWPTADGVTRVAGVSSFGFGGTNAHAILEEAPVATPIGAEPPTMPDLLALSARSPEALRELARRHVDALTDPTRLAGASLRDIAYTAAVRRTHHRFRAAVVGGSNEEWAAALKKVASGETVTSGPETTAASEVVFVYSGQGSQWAAMGRELAQSEPVFKAALERCDAAARGITNWSLIDELFKSDESSRINQTAIAQPLIFAVQAALTELWKSWGIEPVAVVGHSAGEVAAAYAAGIFSLEAAVRLTVRRGEAMEPAAGRGDMAAVELPVEQARDAMRGFEDRLAVASVNSPTSCVISGDKAALETMVTGLKKNGVFAKCLGINYAFHSEQMTPFQSEIVRTMKGVEVHKPAKLIVSTVTGQLAAEGDFTAEYWARNVRETVRFADAIDTLAARGLRTFVEVGPHPVLCSMIARANARSTNGLTAVGSLRRGVSERRALLESLAILYARGVRIDWRQLYPAPGRVMALPRYPWQRQRHWLKPRTSSLGVASNSRVEPAEHPILKRRLPSGLPTFEGELDGGVLPLLREHELNGVAVVAATAYVDLALSAARLGLGRAWRHLRDLTIIQPAIVDPADWATIQITLTPETAVGALVRVFTRSAAGGEWTLHATATVAEGSQPNPAHFDRSAVCARLTERDPGECYRQFAAQGLAFGETFRRMERLWLGDGEAVAAVRVPASTDQQTAGFTIDPASLDACLQPLIAMLPTGDTYALGGIENVVVENLPQGRIYSHVSLRQDASGSSRAFAGDVYLFDEEGRALGELTGLRIVRADVASISRGHLAADSADWLYELKWRRDERPDVVPAPPRDANGTVLRRISAPVMADLPGLIAAHDLARHRKAMEDIEDLGLRYVLQAFESLGRPLSVRASFSCRRLAVELRIVERYHRLFTRLCQMLAEAGVLEVDGDDCTVVSLPTRVNVAGLPSVIRQKHPACDAEVDLLSRCGPELARVLRGESDPLQLLFPGGSFETLEKLYESSPFALVDNELLRSAVRAAVAALPSDRKIRVLEVGAGTGGSTTHVLKELPSERSEYAFTDLSPLFLARAKQKFKSHPYIRYEPLNIEHDPAAQGFERARFDLIVAANVLHATADLGQTLRHVRSLLAPNGVALLLEVTHGSRLIDLTFGLTEGWWRFTDIDRRSSGPLLPSKKWIDLLTSVGFAAANTIPDEESDGATRASVIVATTRPEDAVANPLRPSWIIYADSGGVGDTLAHALEARGAVAVVAVPSDQIQPSFHRTVAVDAGREDDFARALNQAASLGVLQGVLYLSGLDAHRADGTAAEIMNEQLRVTGALLRAMQATIASSSQPRLWIMTRLAQVVTGNEESVSEIQASLWGLGRVFGLEHPELWGGVIDLDDDSVERQANFLAAELSRRADDADEDQLAWRDGEKFVLRLVRRREVLPPSSFVPGDGAYLITGGLGGLGVGVARWLAERGARHLVLLGRPSPSRSSGQMSLDDREIVRRRQAVTEIEALGATVTVVSGDVADEGAMTDLFARFGSTLPELRGVIHAAALVTPVSLAQMTPGQLDEAFRAKVGGSKTLDRLTSERHLDFFVLYSSTTALFGASGMGHYAAANLFMDALAYNRSRRGLPALSINWGTWEDMRTFSESERQAVVRSGLEPMRTAGALEILGRVMTERRPQQVVGRIDWTRLKSAYEARRVRPLFADVDVPAARTSAVSSSSELTLRQMALSAPPADRHDLLVRYVERLVNDVMGFDSSRSIDPAQGLFDMGMDSLMSVDLRTRLGASVGQQLPSTLAFNYPSVAALVGYLEREVFATVAATPAADETRGEAVDVTAPSPSDLANLSDADCLELVDAELAAIDSLLKDA